MYIFRKNKSYFPYSKDFLKKNKAFLKDLSFQERFISKNNTN